MKSLKTLNLTHECIRLIRTKPNQSAFVERAVWKLDKLEKDKQKEIDAIDVSDMPTKRLLVILGLRKDCEPSIRALINHHLYEAE